VIPARLFTPEEATAELPRVREELERMRECLAFLRRASMTAGHGVEIETERQADPETQRYHWALGRLEAAQRRLAEHGIEIRDVDRGLVDFPARHGAQVVLLCWLEGEDSVAFFHDAASGFGGRRPIAELDGPA
jgi:hypothetical protein